MRACYTNLSSKQIQPDGFLKERFKQVDDFQILKANIARKKKLLEEGLDNKYISQEEYIAMDPDNKDIARF